MAWPPAPSKSLCLADPLASALPLPAHRPSVEMLCSPRLALWPEREPKATPVLSTLQVALKSAIGPATTPRWSPDELAFHDNPQPGTQPNQTNKRKTNPLPDFSLTARPGDI